MLQINRITRDGGPFILWKAVGKVPVCVRVYYEESKFLIERSVLTDKINF